MMRFFRCVGILVLANLSLLSQTAEASAITTFHTVLFDSSGNAVPGTITASLDLYIRPYGAFGGGCCSPLGPATLVDQFSLGEGSDFTVFIPTAIVDTHASWIVPIPTGSGVFGSFPLPGLNQLAQTFPGGTDVASLFDWCTSPFAGSYVNGIFVVAQRGTCAFADKVENIELHNGVGAIIVNNIPGAGAFGMALPGVTPSIPVIGLSHARGQQIMQAFTSTGTDNIPELLYIDFAARWDPDPRVVPEPTSLLLLGSGLIGAGIRRWRQRRA